MTDMDTQTDLQKWLKAQRGRGVWLAKRLGTDPAYVRQLAAKWQGRRPSKEMAARIEVETAGAVRADSLRPDATFGRDNHGRITGVKTTGV